MSVTIVGAGISGLACAQALVEADIDVRVLERSRVVGGRLATKRYEGRRTDIGAAYFTVGDPDFAAVVDRWRNAGLAREWTDTLTAIDGDDRRETTGPMRWAAPGGLRTLAEELAVGLPIEQRDVFSVEPGPLVDDERADAVVLAMPGPQALEVLAPALGSARAAARAQEWLPSLAVTLRYSKRTWDLRGAFVNGHTDIRMICDDGDRRGDGAPVLVVHTTADYSVRYLANPDGARYEVAQTVERILDLPDEPVASHVHRWTYAQPKTGSDKPFHLDSDRIGICGDAWGTPRVETAWHSGRALGQQLASQLG